MLWIMFCQRIQFLQFATAEFTTIDAAENKDITLSGITLSGTNAEKYSCEETVVIKGKIIPVRLR